MLTCGPAPVKAILKGDIYIGFETKFLFAELNGGRIHWQVDADGNMEPFMGGRSVGAAVSTKSVGSISREDLTASYKHPEGECPFPHSLVYLFFLLQSLLMESQILFYFYFLGFLIRN